MADIAYTMTIDSLDVAPWLDGLTKVATRVLWTIRGTDGEREATSSACTELPPPESDFVAYADLTEAMVISWVEAHTDAAYLQSRRDHVAQQIAEMIAPPVITPPLPWGQSEAEPV